MHETRWWQHGIIYQIYPRSFMDSNDDGIGDLAGIRERLDYLCWLGVDAIWLSPIYPSPMADFGYDVSDYTDIDPRFGTLADFDRLVAEVHRRGLKLVLDFVPNHSSDQHPWFQESRASRDNPKRDWYIWRDPAPDGGPPNNWRSVFGGSAWEWDEQTGKYYYHAFVSEQPDLNWRHPALRQAMLDNLRFWLDRGVDGFRVDVIWHLIKDEQFRDNPPNPQYRPGQSPYEELLATYSTDRPEVHDVIAEMRALLDGYDDRMMVGEIYLPLERLVSYYGVGNSGCHLPFNFQLIQLPWKAEIIREAVNRYEGLLPPDAWPNWVLGNHDKSRIASRVGPAQARVAAMLLLTLRGTPTLYYGDEIGMHDVSIPPDRVLDPVEKNLPGLGLGRDPERTPMQWDGSDNAGFTRGEPWLPLADDYRQINVAREREDPRSMLSLHRRLIALRRAHRALVTGAYRPLPASGDLMAFLREDAAQGLLVVLNLGAAETRFVLPPETGATRLLLSTHLDREGEQLSGEIDLRGDEGLLLELVQH